MNTHNPLPGAVPSLHQLIEHQVARTPEQVVMVTECSMAANVAMEAPGVNFVRPCNLCPHMKKITLAGIRHSLETMTHEVVVEPAVAARARRSVEAMLAVGAR